MMSHRPGFADVDLSPEELRALFSRRWTAADVERNRLAAAESARRQRMHEVAMAAWQAAGLI